MNKLSFFLVTILLFLCVLQSCETKNKKVFKKQYYASGKLKSKGWYLKDTIWVDTMYNFYENGNLSSIDVRNDSGILNGVAKLYYENGNPYQILYYADGLIQGFSYQFNKDGTLDTKNFFVNDIQVGDVFGFNKNKQINYYGFYEWHGHNINLITYDSVTGEPVKDMRQTIYLDSVKTHITTIDKKQKYLCDVMLVISNPPKCRSTVRIEYLSKNNFLIESDSVTGKPYYFVKKLLPDSLFAIRFVGHQYDSLTQESYEQWNRKMINKK